MNNRTNLSSLDMIARAAKETTIPVSLRVKEKTHAVFSYYAKQYGTTVGSIINELLDEYVSMNESIDYQDVQLDDYIRSKARKLSQCSNDELLTKIIQSGLLDNYKENPGALIVDIREMCKEKVDRNRRNGSDDGLSPRVNLGDLYNTSIIASHEDEASVEEIGEEKSSNVLYIPAAKWTLATAILISYAKKYKTLYGYSKEKQPFLIDIRTLKGIVSATDKKKPIEMASQIAKSLEKFKTPED